MLLAAKRSHLIVVDLQARLVPALAEAERLARNAAILLKAAERLGVPVTVTEQYPKGLGPTIDSIADALPTGTVIVPKLDFAASSDGAFGARVAPLRDEGHDQAVICGAEAHVCVLQTALGLKAQGFEVFVVGDAVSSRSPHSTIAARGRLLQAACRWVTTEMVVFEWLARAGSEDFRAISALIR